MAVIDLCSSAGVSGNTGAIACDPKRANAQAIIVSGAEFTPAEFATSAAFKTALTASMKLATGASGKSYPFPEITTVAENTEANKEATLGNGTRITLSEGRPSYTFSSYIGVNLEKQLRKFNFTTVPVFVFDDKGNVWGRINAAGNFVGISANLFTRGAGFGDFNNAKEVQVSVSFLSASDFFDHSRFASTDFNVADLVGLLDAELSQLAAPTGNAHKIGVHVINTQLGSNSNLYDQYATELAASPTLWVGKSSAGAVVAATTVVVDTALEGWTVTFASAVVSYNLASPTILDAADVVGIEGVEYVI